MKAFMFIFTCLALISFLTLAQHGESGMAMAELKNYLSFSAIVAAFISFGGVR
jgi:hypothetical protein